MYAGSLVGISNERISHSFPPPAFESAVVLSDASARRERFFFLRGAGPTCFASQRASRFFGAYAFFDRGHAARTLPPRRCFFFFACAATGRTVVVSAEYAGADSSNVSVSANAPTSMSTRRMARAYPPMGEFSPPLDGWPSWLRVGSSDRARRRGGPGGPPLRGSDGGREDQLPAVCWNGTVKVSLTVVGTSAPCSLQVNFAVDAFMLPLSTGTQR